MITKLFEVRDRMTCIPIMATDMDTTRYLIRRAGFGDNRSIMVTTLHDPKAQYDPYNWGQNSTMEKAHIFIDKHWDELVDGQVIDVEFIEGKTASPKVSEEVSNAYDLF